MGLPLLRRQLGRQWCPENQVEWACRPDSVRPARDVTVIRLGRPLPDGSCHLPARWGERPGGLAAARAYSMLLRMGFGLPQPSPVAR